jgi:hypothetical protein
LGEFGSEGQVSQAAADTFHDSLSQQQRKRIGIIMTVVFVLAAFFIVYGVFCVIFAFKDPPDFISSAFKIPAVMVFLPDRLVVPVGRIVVALCAFAAAAFMIVRALAA